MKLTTAKLRQIIKEELNKVLETNQTRRSKSVLFAKAIKEMDGYDLGEKMETIINNDPTTKGFFQDLTEFVIYNAEDSYQPAIDLAKTNLNELIQRIDEILNDNPDAEDIMNKLVEKEAEGDNKTFEGRLEDAIKKNKGIKLVELGFDGKKSITRPDAENIYMNNLLPNKSDTLIDALKVKSIRFNDNTLIKVIDERYANSEDYTFFKKLTPARDKMDARDVEKRFLEYLADNKIPVSLF